jgi:hypothetical protein
MDRVDGGSCESQPGRRFHVDDRCLREMAQAKDAAGHDPSPFETLAGD